METVRRKILIVCFVIALATLLQLIRLNYIVEWSKSKNEFNEVDIGKKAALPSDTVKGLSKEKILIIYDEEEQESILVEKNIAQVLSYMKKSCDSKNVKEVKAIDDSYMSVILTLSEWNKFGDMNHLIQYIQKGGNVFFAQTPVVDDAFFSIYRKLGIYEVGPPIVHHGIELLSNILIKGKGTRVDEHFLSNFSLSVRLKDTCTVYAKSADGIPLLWESGLGEGKIMLFNGTMLDERMHRGIIAGALSFLNEDFIYPIMNTKVAFIDGFPAPINMESDDIYERYGKSPKEFYREIWWPDIVAGGLKYDVKYTGVFVQTYNDRVEPPFGNPIGLDGKSFTLYGRELLKYGGELGFQGYNHQPLTAKALTHIDLEYNVWPDTENMLLAVEEAVRFAKAGFPYYALRCYMPPSNVLSPEGRQALVAGMPDLKIISSVYQGDGEKDEYVQEYGVSSDGIVDFPMMTSGSFNDSDTYWMMLNGITSLGVFSHSIHPDAFLDPEKSRGYDWENIYREYTQLLKGLKNRYGWLRSMTVSQAAEEVKRLSVCDLYVQRHEENIRVYCNYFIEELQFILRTEKNIISAVDCEWKKIDDDFYLIRTEKPVFSIQLGR